VIEKVLDYAVVFVAALVPTLLLVPPVIRLLTRLGMVDMPGARRINSRPIPRGGGIALVVGALLPYSVFVALSGRPAIQGVGDATALKMALLSVAIAVLGFFDDKFSLSPKVKLLGQVLVALGVWFWADLGFSALWPQLPGYIDLVLTVVWIVGAVNAFNLIDGLDGLASGIAFIATIGMAGGIFLMNNPQQSLFYFAFAGALLGFLRYNYNPASVFLGDAGSMFIGFVISTLPLLSQDPNSILVSVGMPLLAMGVPIFDTSLAILRRLLRKLFYCGGSEGKVMSADKDHLHHRILRSCNLNQRRAAWILYALTAFGVVVGLTAMFLESRTAGLWLFAVAVASMVIFRDMSSIELYETGKFFNEAVHRRDVEIMLHNPRISVPLYIFMDVVVLTLAYFLGNCLMERQVAFPVARVEFLVWSVSIFVSLVIMRAYNTVWSRSSVSNYLRLTFGIVAGALACFIVLYYLDSSPGEVDAVMIALCSSMAVAGLSGYRFLRSTMRDIFYEIDRARLKARGDVSRVLVYGAGLRYSAFRRELVRNAYAGDRIIVGIVDDNLSLIGKYVGEVKVLGSRKDIGDLALRLSIDSLVVTCELGECALRSLSEELRPSGIKITEFSFGEKPVSAPVEKV
jgi:UDP-N-acetylmuramyl pentapeptide phosphotransferase/UDP-N-acetylglucosamine-1-phosphate transferase